MTARVGATYLSVGWLYLAIELHYASPRLVHTTDIRVCYFLVGVIAVLAYRIATPWRWGYLAVLIVISGGCRSPPRTSLRSTIFRPSSSV